MRTSVDKRRKVNDGLPEYARRAKPQVRRQNSIEAGIVKSRFRGDRLHWTDVGNNGRADNFYEQIEHKREMLESSKGDGSELASQGRNGWCITKEIAVRDDPLKNRNIYAENNLDIDRKGMPKEKLRESRNDDEVRRLAHISKRSRDENIRHLVDPKKKKKSEQELEPKRELLRKSQAKEINHVSGGTAASGGEKGNSISQLETHSAVVHSELLEECGLANQVYDVGHRRDGEDHTRHVKDGSKVGNGHKADSHEGLPTKIKERTITRFHHGTGRFDAPSQRKDRLCSVICEYNTSPVRHVGYERKRGGSARGYDGQHRRFPRESVRGYSKADRRVESKIRYGKNVKEKDERFTRRRPTYRVQEYDKVRRQSHKNAQYLDNGVVKEKWELCTRALKTRDGTAMIDLTETNYENASLMTDVWEVKRIFSSKIVVPDLEWEESNPLSASVPTENGFVRESNHVEEESSKAPEDVGQGVQSQRATQLEKCIKTEGCPTRGDERSKDEDVEANQDKADEHRESEVTKLQHENSRLAAISRLTRSDGGEKTSAKVHEVKERHARRKVRETKHNSELQGKDEHRRGLEVAVALGKNSSDLKSTRPEGMISRKSPEMYLSKAVKGGKERKVKSKEYVLRRQAIKVGRARDVGGQDLSSHEPKHHKHRRRSYSISPKLRNLSPEKKEHGKSMSPRRSEKDLSEWEKFERERNNTLAAFDSRYRRFGGGTSGLGGYSPRRRRSEAAIKTPSPPPRSPERRKPRAWDLPPPGMDRSMVAAISAAHQAAAHQAAIQHAAAVASVTPLVSGSVHLSPGATSASASCGLTPAPTMIPSLLHQVNPAVTAVTLTQATRPLRRLYVGNVPATVSDGELLEFMNAAMLSANANHLAGTKPCINCTVNVDKSYAFAEFITPEDATAALAFDGVTLHGTTLKIRRPKDFAQPANGGAENASPILDMVSSTVADSPRKVFVGGISSSLSSEKVKEIVTAFGQLKAYHWEVDKTKQPSQAYAFLEYMDPTATPKACAGLNGMKLGTSFLTVVQATPDASLEVDYTAVPSYRVPEHARPLLQAPSRILELQNMVTEDELHLMSKQDLDEIIEDIRLECSRFGNVKSMHLVQSRTPHYHGTEKITPPCSREDPGSEGRFTTGSASVEQVVALVQQSALSVGDSPNENLLSFPSQETGGSCYEQADEKNRITKSDLLCYGEVTKISGDKSRCSGIFGIISTDTSGAQTPNTLTTLEDFDCESTYLAATSGSKPAKDVEGDTPSDFYERSTDSARIGASKEGSDASPREVGFLHVGKVYVEFSREESACQAAHALHGRTFAGRKVWVSYFPLKVYQKKFHKGLGPRTYEEKQALALAVQGHLTAHIKD